MGISFVTPGLCSASMGISLGVYEDIIELFSSFYKLKTIKKHLLLILGIFTGLVLCFLIFINLFEKYSIYLSSLFIGFILGDYLKDNKIKMINRKNILYFILGIIIVSMFYLLGNIQLIKKIEMSSFIFLNLSLFFVSILASIALILPGISGSMILFMFGVYEKISESIELIINNILTFQPLIDENFVYIVTFLASFLLGILVFSKIIDKFIKTNNSKFLVIINGFVVGSMLILMYEIVVPIKFFYEMILCFIFILFGLYINNKVKKSNE